MRNQGRSGMEKVMMVKIILFTLFVIGIFTTMIVVGASKCKTVDDVRRDDDEQARELKELQK